MGRKLLFAGVGAVAASAAAGYYYGPSLCRMARCWYKSWCLTSATLDRASIGVERALDEQIVIVKEVSTYLRDLDHVEVVTMLDAADTDLDDALDDRDGPFDMWRAAYRWSRRARMEKNYPSLTPANRIVVSDWLRKKMVEEHVRPSQMVRLLPVAISLTFVRSTMERDLLEMEKHLANVPGLLDVARK